MKARHRLFLPMLGVASCAAAFWYYSERMVQESGGAKGQANISDAHANEETASSQRRMLRSRDRGSSPEEKIAALKKSARNAYLDEAVRSGILLELIPLYVQHDPEACWTWLKEFQADDSLQTLASRSFSVHLAKSDPDFWKKTIEESPTPLRDHLIEGGILGLAEKDISSAWIKYQSLKHLLDDAGSSQQGMIAYFAFMNAGDAMDILRSTTTDSDPEQIRSTYSDFFSNARFRTPSEAVAAVHSIADSSLANYACESYLTRLNTERIKPFIDGLSSLGRDDIDLEKITLVAAERLYYNDPVECAQLTPFITDDESRAEIEEKIIAYVQRNRPELETEVLEVLR